jgi:hypothetical protein
MGVSIELCSTMAFGLPNDRSRSTWDFHEIWLLAVLRSHRCQTKWLLFSGGRVFIITHSKGYRFNHGNDWNGANQSKCRKDPV